MHLCGKLCLRDYSCLFIPVKVRKQKNPTTYKRAWDNIWTSRKILRIYEFQYNEEKRDEAKNIAALLLAGEGCFDDASTRDIILRSGNMIKYIYIIFFGSAEYAVYLNYTGSCTRG